MSNALIFPGKLPLACLVRPDPVAELSAAPVWFHLDDATRLTLNAAGNVTHWQAQGDAGPVARAVSYNRDGTVRDGPHLRFAKGRHGGLVIDRLPLQEIFSIGLIYRTEAADPGTILTIQGEDGYAFIAAEAGQITFGSKDGGPGLDQPDVSGTVLLLCALSATANRIAVNRAPVLTGPGRLPSGPLEIYIGCRGGKRSLLNKLGTFRLSDVMVWPGIDILAPGAEDSTQAARDLHRRRADAI